ncbi:MAG: MBL fold metallo-hydrolase [Lachnospiraceae bacterium]|nr:MBL fold metallo-hydrolase [Lachnospiraceae bacterium]MBR5994392.1 MBL fold metallo-hydrolase [Lachnospiraceae bacterium]
MADVIKINENTFRIEDGMVRFFLLLGSEKALMIDSGMTTKDARKIAEGLTNLPIELMNTHGDGDHIAGNAAFDTFYMGPADADNLARKAADLIPRITPVHEGDVIDLGGRPLEIIDNPGHTPGSIAILDINNRVLIGGDAIQNGNIYMFGAHRNINDYVKSLKHLLTFKKRFDTVYPSHGSFPVEPDLIEKLIEGAESIIRDEVKGEDMDLYGNPITLYKFPFAGFYGEREK